mgnify:FL=1
MIICLASYPKSGNTWVRLFLDSYFNLIGKKIFSQSFPNKDLYKKFKINYSNFGEIIENWESMQNYLNLKSQTNYFKTHNALCTINNHKFTDKKNTLGAIYIVRDPRDVLISYANHLGQNHQKILRLLLNKHNGETDVIEGKEFRRTLMGRWSDHYNSWKSYKEREVLIVKYEDLVKNTKKEFLRILNYLNKIDGIKIDINMLNKSIEETSFDKLAKKEKKFGFEEASKFGVFFRKGIVGDWKNNLDISISKILEKEFVSEMKELDYI